MSDTELSFEELTGTTSVDEWSEITTDEELSGIAGLAQQLLDVQKEIENTKLKLKFYKGHISEAHRPAAVEWLMANGHGGLIKNEVTVKFGKDEDDRARATVQSLLQQGLSPNVKQGVHPQTLNAFVKEQLTGGMDLPADIFGIYVGSRAKIDRKR